MSEWRPEGMPTAYEAVEKIIDYDGKPIRGNARAGFLDGYERAERAMLEALRERAKKCAESSVLLREHLENVQADGVWVFIPDKE